MRAVKFRFCKIPVFGRPFVKRFALCYRSVVCPASLSVLSVCDVGVLWPNGWVDQDENWHAGRPRPWPHCIDGDPAVPPPKGHNPQFSAHICCGQMTAWINMSLGTKLGLGPGDFVLDGNPTPPPLKGGGDPKNFRSVYCGQTAGWVKIVLGKEVGFSPGDFVLEGVPVPLPKRGRTPSPIFGPFLLWPNGWMHQDATCYGCRPQPMGPFVRWAPSPLPQKGAEPLLKFSAHVYCGQTAGWIKMTLGMKVGLSPGDSVLDGDPAPPHKGV